MKHLSFQLTVDIKHWNMDLEFPMVPGNAIEKDDKITWIWDREQSRNLAAKILADKEIAFVSINTTIEE